MIRLFKCLQENAHVVPVFPPSMQMVMDEWTRGPD